MAERTAVEFDPTPARLVGARNLRLALKSEWARIRNRHFTSNGTRCELCGDERGHRKRIDAHEVYSYPSPQVVRLERIIFICRLCHDAIHLERTRWRCQPPYIAEVEAHYCRVNRVSRREMERSFAHCMMRGVELRKSYGDKASPRIDYGDYQVGVDAAFARKRGNDDDDTDFEMYPDHECPWDVGHAG